jgi:hypothetical protein
MVFEIWVYWDFLGKIDPLPLKKKIHQVFLGNPPDSIEFHPKQKFLQKGPKRINFSLANPCRSL